MMDPDKLKAKKKAAMGMVEAAKKMMGDKLPKDADMAIKIAVKQPADVVEMPDEMVEDYEGGDEGIVDKLLEKGYDEEGDGETAKDRLHEFMKRKKKKKED